MQDIGLDLLNPAFRAATPSQSPSGVARKKQFQELDMGGVSAFSMPRHCPGQRCFQPRCLSILKYEAMAPKEYRTPISGPENAKVECPLWVKSGHWSLLFLRPHGKASAEERGCQRLGNGMADRSRIGVGVDC